MRRNAILLFSLLLIVIPVLCSCGEPAPTAEQPLELKFSYHTPPEASLAEAILVPWADQIEQDSGGRVEITHYSGGTLVGVEDAYDAVVSGLCDIALIDPEENPGRFPLAGINSLPFLYPSTEIAGAVSHELLNEYCVDTELDEVVLLITAPLHSAQYLGEKPIETLADFSGLNLRSAGSIEAATVTALGATPVEVSTGDLSSALDRGTVDGCFFTWSGALAFGVKDVTTYRTECNIFPRVFFIVINRDVFDDMPNDIQQIFLDNATVEVSQSYAAAHAAMEAGKKGAIEGSDKGAGNPAIYVLPDTERELWKAACEVVWDEWVADMVAEDLPGQEMLDDALALIDEYTK